MRVVYLRMKLMEKWSSSVTVANVARPIGGIIDIQNGNCGGRWKNIAMCHGF